jgi:hypothetical protein
MNDSSVEEVSLTAAKKVLVGWWDYLLSKWLWIGLTGLVFGVAGIFYAYSKKPVYTAELAFAAESGKAAMGGYAGLAAQFGLEMGGSNAFEGDNLIYLLKSRNLIDRTFLTPVNVDGKKQLLVEYYILTKLEGSKKKSPYSVTFSPDQQPGNRLRDSLMKSFHQEVTGALNIFRVDRRIDLIVVQLQSEDEVFAKIFVENLTNNAIQYFVDYRSKKARQNVAILQRQTDSIRRLITGGITSIAVSNDLNVNPLRQVSQVGAQRKGIDVQVNSALYTDLAKNLQASGIVMRQETPFIQIVDTPILPLDKKKAGKAKSGIIFAIMGGFLSLAFFIIKRMIKNNRKPQAV